MFRLHGAAAATFALIASSAAGAAEVIRHSFPDVNTPPIARAVEVPAGSTIIFHSGITPRAADAKAEFGTPAYWGNTETQTMSALGRLKESLESMGVNMGKVVAMTVYLVGDPARGGQMDFAGMMAAYRQFFGTREQPNLPARSTVQVAALASPGMLVEIEVQVVR